VTLPKGEEDVRRIEHMNKTVTKTKFVSIPSFPVMLQDNEETSRSFLDSLFWKQKLSISMFDVFLMDRCNQKLKDLGENLDSDDFTQVSVQGALSCLGFPTLYYVTR
jgi:hypothetical protein